MSRLLTPKQEKFCQQFISTGNASEAYRQSYDCSRMKNATINRAAHDLVENSKVTARIGELQEEGRKRHDIPFVVDHGATTITGLQGSINLHIGIVVTHA